MRLYHHGAVSVLPVTGNGRRSPVIWSISPTSGPQGGGTLVTLTGQWYNTFSATAPSSLTIGNAELTGVVVVNDTTITGTTAAMASGGVKDCVIVNNNGSDTLRRCFSV